MRTVLSEAPETRKVPSSFTEMLLILEEWPSRVHSSCRWWKLQRRIVKSSEADMRYLRSLVRTIDFISEVWPVRTAMGWWSRRVQIRIVLSPEPESR